MDDQKEKKISDPKPKTDPNLGMVDRVLPRGELEIFKIYDDGKKERVDIGDNLIVDVGHDSLAILISGDDEGINDKTIGKMSWGDGGHDTGNPTLALPPLPTDVALAAEHAATGKKVVTNDFPATDTARFIATIEKSELIGDLISEVGLFTKDDTLFARRTFGALLKSSEFALEFRWSIIT